MAAFLAVLTVGFLVLGLLISHYLGSFFMRSKVQVLLDAGTMALRLGENPLFGGPGSGPFSLGLVGLSRGCHCRIWVVDPHGTVLATANPHQSLPALPGRNLNGIFAGNLLIAKSPAGFNRQLVLVGLPWYRYGMVRYAVILRAENPTHDLLASGTYRELWLAYGLAAALATLLAYLVARWLSAPLHEMNLAATDIARGNFKRRVRVHGADEVGQLAASFNNMAQRLDRIEETRREFLSNVSHELRSPLTSIQGFLQAVMEGAVPAGEEARYLSLAFDEGLRLTRLVRDLLDLSSIESGNFQLSLAEVAPKEVILRTIAALEPQFMAKKLEPVLNLPERELRVQADADRLEQILFNLLSNAIRFSPVGGRVEVACRSAGTGLQVEVTDHGPGISPTDLPHIFDRFYKADPARTTAAGGTGLGLAITRELVKAHGGGVRAENLPPPGRGARFIFTIPFDPKRAGGN